MALRYAGYVPILTGVRQRNSSLRLMTAEARFPKARMRRDPPGAVLRTGIFRTSCWGYLGDFYISLLMLMPFLVQASVGRNA